MKAQTHTVAVYSMAAELVCEVRVDGGKAEGADRPPVTIEDLRLPTADQMNALPGLLKFLPFGDRNAAGFREDEDLSDVRKVLAVVCRSPEKREEYLQQGRERLAGRGTAKGNLLEDFLWDELDTGAAFRCAEVRPRGEVNMDDLVVFGAIFENLQDAERLAEIFHLFDLQEEVIDPLVNNVLAPLNQILEGDRPDRTASFIPVVVDWMEGLYKNEYGSSELNMDCFFTALLKHVDRDPAFWTLERRRAAWRRDWDAQDELGMTLSVLCDVFDLICSGRTMLGTWPVLWDFMRRFGGVTADALRRATVPGLQPDAFRERGYVPFAVYDAMRDHSEAWQDLVGYAGYLQRKAQGIVDFWIALMELFSEADIRALREGSHSRDFYLVPRPAAVDFFTYPLVDQVPFLADCKANSVAVTERAAKRARNL